MSDQWQEALRADFRGAAEAERQYRVEERDRMKEEQQKGTNASAHALVFAPKILKGSLNA